LPENPFLNFFFFCFLVAGLYLPFFASFP